MRMIALFVGMLSFAAVSFAGVLEPDLLNRRFEAFNATDDELYTNTIDNAHAACAMRSLVPLFECPDEDITRTYYFRWWTYRKHLRRTSDGWVVTEFLPKVSWSGAENTISCPLGHHLREGRWLRDKTYLDDYTRFMLTKGAINGPRAYVNWPAWATLERAKVSGDMAFAVSMLPLFEKNHELWRKGWPLCRNTFMTGQDPQTKLFRIIDNHEGTEMSLSPQGERPMVNSAMWAEAVAISEIARFSGARAVAERYKAEAASVEEAIKLRLWHHGIDFFTARGLRGDHGTVRELHGYAPFYFGMPLGRMYQAAWRPLMRSDGFLAKWGLTFPEQSAPGFRIAYEGHMCQWNGPSWPYATSIALTALYAGLQSDARSSMPVTAGDFAALLRQYAAAHVRRLDDGRTIPWIDENQNPYTGDWIARTIILATPSMRSHYARERGKDYNHSTFCDLVIAGLCGIVPHADGRIDVRPLAPREWDWWCVDGVRYHGHDLTVLFDRDGTRYGKGKGLVVLRDGMPVTATSLWYNSSQLQAQSCGTKQSKE